MSYDGEFRALERKAYAYGWDDESTINKLEREYHRVMRIRILEHLKANANATFENFNDTCLFNEFFRSVKLMDDEKIIYFEPFNGWNITPINPIETSI